MSDATTLTVPATGPAAGDTAGRTLPPCRSCGAADLVPFIDLGSMPLPDNILSAEQAALAAAGDPGAEPRFPLDAAFCPRCTLVQITAEVPPEQLFVDNYQYYSSFSPALLAHSREHALGLIEKRGLGPDSFVVELASNDGYLLRNFVEAGIEVLGVDPAPGQAEAAEAVGVPTLREFFGPEVARRIRAEHGAADVIVANNVMAHVPDLNGFVEGMAHLISDEGVITVENPWVLDLVEHCEFDTIYHEHFCYFSCTSVQNLARRHGLHLNDVEYFPDLHGGTLRWHLGRQDKQSDRARDFLAREEAAGVTTEAYYAGFAARVAQLRTDLRELLTTLRAQGARIAAYGAAAKGSVMLNYCGIGTDLAEYVVDRNPHKHGRVMPGTHQPIRPTEALVQDRPDYVLLLAWNFKDEIVRQQAEYVAGGGRFVVPVPTPVVVP